MSTVRVGSTFHVAGVTREQVWAYLERIEHAADWNTFVQEASSDDPPGVGREIELRIGFLGVTFSAAAVATESDPPRRSVIEGRRPFAAEIGMELTETDAGVVLEGWFEMRPGRFFPVPRFALRRAVQQQYERDSALLQSCLEALAD